MYRMTHPEDKTWERVERRLYEEEAAYTQFSYLELTVWVMPQLVSTEKAVEHKEQLLKGITFEKQHVRSMQHRPADRRGGRSPGNRGAG